MLLEDDVALRSLLLELLESEGYAVRIFESFETLQAAAAAGQGDLIVADFWGAQHRSLPDDERCRIQTLGRLVPLVLITGRTWALEMTAAELDTRALLRKPFDLEDLLGAIHGALNDVRPD